MSLTHLSINFLGFLEIFRLCLYHRRLFLKYLVLNFVAIFLEETLRERDPSQERIPSQAGGRTSTRDQLGPSPSSGAGSCASSTPAGWSMSGLWPFSSRSVSVHYFYALDWLVCFRAILNSMGAIISLFSLVSIFKTCVYILICFRFIWKQRGGGSLLSLVLKN